MLDRPMDRFVTVYGPDDGNGCTSTGVCLRSQAPDAYHAIIQFRQFGLSFKDEGLHTAGMAIFFL
ncbi:hypothetical protein [Massilia sp.]|uniref:hypothetical protein n=1 Tax=Massilia sp. TaxID=1882437 RepID=UPI0028968E9D|nr:hypothetical protein [Massilia sp.]